MAASARIARFIARLRAEGFHIGVGETADALRIVESCHPLSAPTLRAGLRALTCQNATEWRRFDRIFDAYWLGQGDPSADGDISAAEAVDPRLLARRQQRGGLTGLAHAMDPANDAYSASLQAIGAGASRQTTLSRADFRFLSDRRDQHQLETLAEKVARRIRRRLTRRLRETTRGRHLSLRRTVRRSLRFGGLPLQPRYLERRRETPPLVWLQDVSHSMAGHSPMLTRFGRGLMRAFPHGEAFVFHVRLYRITSLYREHDVERLRQRLEGRGELWLGGTRIAESLSHFNRSFAGRFVDRRTTVVIVSDGLDSDQPDELVAAVAALRRRACRVIWLNPMLGRDGISIDGEFPPPLRAMLDHIGPAHSLDSLIEAADAIAGACEAMNGRTQQVEPA